MDDDLGLYRSRAAGRTGIKTIKDSFELDFVVPPQHPLCEERTGLGRFGSGNEACCVFPGLSPRGDYRLLRREELTQPCWCRSSSNRHM